MAFGAKQHEDADITERVGRRVEEIGEAGVGWPNEAPDNPSHEQPADEVSGPDMDVEQVILGQIGDRKCHDQGPVEQPHEGIPDIDLRRCNVASIRIEHEGPYHSRLVPALRKIKARSRKQARGAACMPSRNLSPRRWLPVWKTYKEF